MEKNDLLNLLYVERQRLSDQNSQVGWSNWVLIGGVITLSWMLLEHHEAVVKSNFDEFCCSQIITLLKDFLSIAFALLLVMNYCNDRKTKYMPDRFDKSKLPRFIIMDMILAVILCVFLCPFTEITEIIIGNISASFFGIKVVDLNQILKRKQHLPLLFKQRFYLFASVIILVIGVYRICMHNSYNIVNTKYSLLIIGVIIVFYLLLWYQWNPIKRSVDSIDDLIDDLILNKDVDADYVYDKFITIKIGYKYSQLFDNRFYEVDKLIKDEDRYIYSLNQRIERLELVDDIDRCELNLCIEMLNKIKEQHKVISKTTIKLLTKIKSDIDYLSLCKGNIQEFKKIEDIVKSNFYKLDLNSKSIAELLTRFNSLFDKQLGRVINGPDYCKFANNRFLCYSYRLFQYVKSTLKYIVSVFSRMLTKY